MATTGQVFSFGSNSDGRTGIGIDAGVPFIATPIVTSNLGGPRIKQIGRK